VTVLQALEHLLEVVTVDIGLGGDTDDRPMAGA